MGSPVFEMFLISYSWVVGPKCTQTQTYSCGVQFLSDFSEYSCYQLICPFWFCRWCWSLLNCCHIGDLEPRRSPAFTPARLTSSILLVYLNSQNNNQVLRKQKRKSGTKNQALWQLKHGCRTPSKFRSLVGLLWHPRQGDSSGTCHPNTWILSCLSPFMAKLRHVLFVIYCSMLSVNHHYSSLIL